MAWNLSGWAACTESNTVSCLIHYPFYRLSTLAWKPCADWLKLCGYAWASSIIGLYSSRRVCSDSLLSDSICQCIRHASTVPLYVSATHLQWQSMPMHMYVLIRAFGFCAQPFVGQECFGSGIGKVCLHSAHPSYWGCCLISVSQSLLSVWPLPGSACTGQRSQAGHLQVIRAGSTAVIHCHCNK